MVMERLYMYVYSIDTSVLALKEYIHFYVGINL